ncbi:MAG TPA: hypothetical protein VMZ26_00300 [Pyrinomonadaceae bacterium]|nr:hypothetical protein [Pyrinomonadaceae bacterium]
MFSASLSGGTARVSLRVKAAFRNVGKAPAGASAVAGFAGWIVVTSMVSCDADPAPIVVQLPVTSASASALGVPIFPVTANLCPDVSAMRNHFPVSGMSLPLTVMSALLRT